MFQPYVLTRTTSQAGQNRSFVTICINSQTVDCNSFELTVKFIAGGAVDPNSVVDGAVVKTAQGGAWSGK